MIDRTGATAIPAICDVANAPLPGFFSEVPGWIREVGAKEYRAAARPHGARLARLLAMTRDYELAEVLLNLALDPKDLVPVLAELMGTKPDALPTQARSCVSTRRAPSRSPPSSHSWPMPTPRFAPWPSSSSFHSVRREKTRPGAPGPLPRDRCPLDEDSERVRALWALAVIGLPARSVAALTEEVRRASSARSELLSALVRLDPDGAAVVDMLIAQLGESPFGVRMTAADDLAWLGPKAAAAVPALLRALANVATDEAKVRLIEALGAIGPGAAEARPVLLAQLGDVDSLFARSARWALGAIGCPLTPAELAAFGAQLRASPDSADAIVAAQRIGLAGESGKDALPALTGALAARSPRLKIAAAWAIGAIGPAAAAAVPDLMRVLEKVAGGIWRGPVRLRGRGARPHRPRRLARRRRCSRSADPATSSMRRCAASSLLSARPSPSPSILSSCCRYPAMPTGTVTSVERTGRQLSDRHRKRRRVVGLLRGGVSLPRPGRPAGGNV